MKWSVSVACRTNRRSSDGRTGAPAQDSWGFGHPRKVEERMQSLARGFAPVMRLRIN
jgi:hypothetical protein